jgi:hypothetical protein
MFQVLTLAGNSPRQRYPARLSGRLREEPEVTLMTREQHDIQRDRWR